MKAEKPGGLIIDKELIEDGWTVVLGLSGGPDSVCLLYELLALGDERRKSGGTGNPVVCAHVNHGLRGGESDGDEAYASDLCMRLGATFELLHIDTAAFAKERGLTLEEAGREARYAFFDEVCEKYSENVVIAIAHNREDQAETILMRILRGTGTDGIAGMAQRRKSAAGFEIVRPLLRVSRKEITGRLAEYGESARTDGSNLNIGYFRNKLRLEAFPYLEENLKLDLRQGLLRLAENAAEDKNYFDAVVSDAIDEHLEYLEDGSESAAISADLLACVHPAIRHRLIRAAFTELGLDRDIAAVHLAAADRLLKTWQNGGEATGKRVEFPQDYSFGIAGKKAIFRAPWVVESGWKPRRKL